MRLIAPSIEHVRELMRWFADEAALHMWGGPAFRFPFTEDSFLQDMYWGRMATYVLVDVDDRIIAFGQLYEKAGRAHLARLAVSPVWRGVGYGPVLVRKLVEKGREVFPGAENSLYVVRSNERALKCYLKIGFVEAPSPPGDKVHSDQMFMVRR